MKIYLSLLIALFTSLAFGQTRKHTIDADCLRIRDGVCVDKVELGNIDGLTSNAQTQINGNGSRLTTLEGNVQAHEYTNFAAFPATGSANNLYVDKALNKTYRWSVSGSAYVLVGDGTGTGDTTGPSSSTDNAAVRFDGTTGKLVQDSNVSISDAGDVTATSFNAASTASTSTLSGLQINNNQITATAGANLDLNATSGAINVKKKVAFLARKTHATVDDTATGSNVTLADHQVSVVRLTGSGLASIDGIPAGNGGDTRTIINLTGAQIVINNDTGATTANRIYTGTGAALKIKPNGSIQVTYDITAARWYVTSGVSGSAGLGGTTDTMFIQDFEGATAADFATLTGWALNSSSPLHGDIDLKDTHATATTTYSVKQNVTVPPKFRGKNLTIKITAKSSASAGNLVLDAGCTTATDLINGQSLDFSSLTGGNEVYGSFDVPSSCTSLSYTVRALPETGPPVSEIDDIEIFITKMSALSASITTKNSIVTDWVTFTPTIVGSTSNPTRATGATESAQWRRVGDSMEIEYFYSQSSLTGAVAGSGNYLWTIPSGFVIDTTKIATNTGGSLVVGSSRVFNGSGSAWYSGTVFPYSTTQLALLVQGTAYATPNVVGTSWVPFTNASAIEYSFKATVPIVGWTSTETTSTNIPLTKSAFVQDADSQLFLQNFSFSTASTNTQILTLSTPVTLTNTGSAITYNKDAVLGDTFKANIDGTFTFSVVMDSNITTGGYGLSKNSSQLTTAYVSILDANKICQSTFGELQTATCTVKLAKDDIVRLHNQALGTTESASRMSITVSFHGSLRQANVNPNQKIKIPTSELRFEGASARGSTNTSIVVFSTIAKLTGDVFDINPDGTSTTLGTHVKLKKSGWLCVDGNLYLGSAGGYTYLTRNQTSSLTTGAEPTIASEILKSAGVAASAPYLPTTWCGLSTVGDTIRLSASGVPTTDAVNHLHLSFFETDIQVSVSNTLPQFSESDIVLRAAGSSSQAVTADVTNVPFSTVSDTSGAWNGSQYTIPSTGTYNISGSMYFTTSANRPVDLYVDGVLYRRVGDSITSSVYSFAATDSFNAGQVISLRVNNAGGTLQTDSHYHWLHITKSGKPNVTGVDVTSFINAPVLQTDTISAAGVSVSTLQDSTGEIRFGTGTLSSTNQGIISIVDDATGARTKFVANKKTTVTLSFSMQIITVDTGLAIFKNGVNVFNSGLVYSANRAAIASFSVPLDVNDYLTINAGSTAQATTNFYLSLVATSAPDSIITPTESFSIDSTDFTYAPSTTYTLATLANAPKGTYLTYTGGASAQCNTQTTTAPTGQTDAQIKTQGFLLTSKVYTAAGTPNAPCRFDIQIGKGFKGAKIDMYTGPGKSGNSVNYDFFSDSAGRDVGVATSYNETTGVLTVNAGYAWASNSTRWLGTTATDGSATTTAYVDIKASKTPTLSGISYVSPRVAYLSDVKANATDGGTNTAAAYNTRVLNTIDDPSALVSTFSGNQFTLPSGEYQIEGSAPAFMVNNHRARIRNITDATTALLCSTEYSNNTSVYAHSSSKCSGRFVISASKTFELQHFTAAARTTNGLGVSSGSGESEVYSQLKITKVK